MNDTNREAEICVQYVELKNGARWTLYDDSSCVSPYREPVVPWWRRALARLRALLTSEDSPAVHTERNE